ncbi:MAG: hypothetical protein VX100_18845 [Pseudomonadota bacterium]|nr:hypothetical protein [Pseudomonadota bacterium]
MKEKSFKSTYLGSITERELFWLTQDAGLEYISTGLVNILDKYVEPIVENGIFSVERDFKKSNKIMQENIQDYMSECKNNLLPINKFAWIDKNNERLCRFLCNEIKKEKYAPPPVAIPPNEQMHKLGNCTHSPSLRPLTHYFHENMLDTNAMVKHFIYYLDWVFDASLEFKKKTMLALYNVWGDTFTGIDHGWIYKKNVVQINWLWDYLSSYNTSGYVPTSSIDKYYSSILIFDSLYSNQPDSALLLQMKAKKAWSQKKHRDNRNGKKAFNFVMHERTKLMLDELATHEDRKVGEMLERIIKQAHSKAFQ